MVQQHEIYYFSDQPTTCPNYGSRTDIILDMSHTLSMFQVEECLSCGERYLMQDENEHQVSK